ncbi:MAG TPA: SDR family NAD(P)-dependent oxidoreductase [Chthoniobacterales bacterium]|nr:SDR family NAD(P)-dependent oxidoreductase [Chthoniobacterales bacterium]
MSKIFLTGASSGIGLAAAKVLLARGHHVWGTSRDPSRLAQISGLHPVQMDLCDADSLQRAYEEGLRSAGSFDVLINNAGCGHFGAAESLPPDALQRQFQTLVFAHVALCQLAVARMRKSGGGLIINVTSLAADLPVPFMAAYNAAKAAMASFTFTLQLELADTSIRVVDLQPGDINTGFSDALTRSEMTDARMDQAWRAIEKNMVNAPRPALVAERIARLIEEPNPPPRVIVGDFFQSKIAPILYRLLPQSIRIWALRRYYGI